MNWLFGNNKQTIVRNKPRIPLTCKEKLHKLAQCDTYYSVLITRCGCRASTELIGKGFLFQDAPLLPLRSCTAGNCTCEYQGVVNRRHEERRTKERRASVRMDDARRKVYRRKGEQLWNNYTL